jgi:F-type H+-transporting ATPase subunit b
MAFLLTTASEGRLFGLDQQALISVGIQLFNACLLAIALAYILYKPVRKFMRKRADGIQSQFESARAEMAKANELKALCEQRAADIERERMDILEAAHVSAAEGKERMLGEAFREIATMKERADKEIRKDRERVNEEIRIHIIEVASLIAEKFMARSMDEATQTKLFDEALTELECMTWQS